MYYICEVHIIPRVYMYISSSSPNTQVTGTAYLHVDRGRGASADLSVINLRAAVLASDTLTPATGSASSSKDKDKDGIGKLGGDTGNASAAAAAAAMGPTVEAAPFQKVNERVFVCYFFCCFCCSCRCCYCASAAALPINKSSEITFDYSRGCIRLKVRTLFQSI